MPFVGAELEDGIEGLAWLSKHCDCAAELAGLQAYAESQQDVEQVRKFIAALKKFREEK